MLFIVNIKNLSVLTKKFLKLEALCCLSCTAFQRTLITNKVLLSNSLKNSHREPDVHNYPKLSKRSENFGKIVDLDVDFDEVKITGEDIKEEKRKRNNKIYQFGNRLASAEVNEDIKLSNNNLKESEINSVTHPSYIAIKESLAMLKLKSRKERQKSQHIILEGKRLIHEAISSGFLPLQIFFSRVSDLEKLCLPNNVKSYQVPYKNIKLWTDVVTSQGVIGVFEMPKLNTIKDPTNCLPLTIICDNIRDPANLGSILRVAAGIGCEKLILTKGCVDVWESKVLRSGAGSHFKLCIVNNHQWTDIESEISESSKVVLADFCNDAELDETLENENKSVTGTSGFKRRSEISKNLPINCYYAEKYGNESTVIIIGGESHGLSDAAYEFALKRKGARVFIPMCNKTESLNSAVALGIISYEYKRQFNFITGKDSHSETINLNSFENKTS